ncbi:MAG: hydrogenase [Candidatus Hydrogenedentes bacterium]|nr:hydrogenase [Candidatus Hydrogenedentota bacterium]
MTSLTLVLAAILLLACSGLPSLVFSRVSDTGQRWSFGITLAATSIGAVGAVLTFANDATPELNVPWAVPGGAFHVTLDGLSAAFLVSVFLLSALGALYGLSYWAQAEHPENGVRLRFFYGLMTSAMALLLIARNGLLFLTAWEIMALSGFFLIATEHEKKDVQEAGWVYLVATHLSSLLLFGFFAIYFAITGTLELKPFSEQPAFGALLFLIAVAGFGIKAGLFPLHVWLPSAHANAPSHVSALFSGVVIKMGVYGVMRVCWLFPHPPLWWGSLLVALGVVSGVLGVAFALGQHDIKRLLAYHSIENIGIIFMGFGLAMVGRSLGQPALVALGMAGAVLHVWNHGLFKALLFLAAGAVIHATHTRDIERLGGLSKRMPHTALMFLIGAVAICGLPPLNGFISELFVYIGLFRAYALDARSWPLAPFTAAALALIGGLAVACFVKVYGIVFLGEPRTEIAESGSECSPSMAVPMRLLAGLCFLIGLAPVVVVAFMDRATTDWQFAHHDLTPSLFEIAPILPLMAAGSVVAGGTAVVFFMLWRARKRGTTTYTGTWDCGYIAPAARMQYTASSFAQMLVNLFGWALRPHTSKVHFEGYWPKTNVFRSHVPETVLDQLVVPLFRRTADVFSLVRVMQQGRAQLYLVYIVAALLVLLATV